MNNYALHIIEEALAPPPRFALLSFTAKAPTQELARKALSEAMDHLATSLAQLTVEAQVILRHLDALQERLVTLHGMLVREGAALSDADSELLAAFWTKLGGNRDLLRGHDEGRELLDELGVHRSRVLCQVLSALKTLQNMNDDMQNLRARMAAPEIVGSIIPVEFHIQSIRSGLERLTEGRSKAKEREEEARRMLSN